MLLLPRDAHRAPRRIEATSRALAVALLLLAPSPGRSQESPGVERGVGGGEDRWWAVGGQLTTTTFFLPPFRSPYANPAVSFGPGPALGWSLVASVLAGAHLWRGATVVAIGEYANGAGAPNVSGVSGYPDGNMIRVTKVGTAPYLARAFLHQDVDLGGSPEPVEDEAPPEGGFMPTGPVALGRARPPNRLEITVGKFGSNDFLDVAEASSDPRHRFLDWALMQNGAWDYVADTRGYTWGVEVGLETRRWAVRALAALMPTTPNGSVFDGNLATSGSYAVEGQYGWGAGANEGSVKLLAYLNRGNLGSYADALAAAAAGPRGSVPDVDATARPGAYKYGFGLLAQQGVGPLDLFLRIGWNDGRTQTFCFTSIDRSISVGAQLDGATWGRPGDAAGAGVAVSGISSSHAAYLAAGGTEFQLGDGGLTYGWEVVPELYYSLQPARFLEVTADVQAVFDPGMNAARGPAVLGGIRVHAHF